MSRRPRLRFLVVAVTALLAGGCATSPDPSCPYSNCSPYYGDRPWYYGRPGWDPYGRYTYPPGYYGPGAPWYGPSIGGTIYYGGRGPAVPQPVVPAPPAAVAPSPPRMQVPRPPAPPQPAPPPPAAVPPRPSAGAPPAPALPASPGPRRAQPQQQR